MASQTVNFIAVNSDNYNDHDARTIARSFESILWTDSAIICSSSPGAVKYAALLSEITGIPLFYCNFLADAPQSPDTFPKGIEVKELEPKFIINKQKIMELDYECLLNTFSGVFIYLDSNFLDNYYNSGVLIAKKDYDTAYLYTYDHKEAQALQEHAAPDIDLEKVQETLTSTLKTALSEVFRDNSKDAVRGCEKLKDKMNELALVAKEVLKMLVVTSESHNEREKQKIGNIQQKVEALMNQFSELKSVIARVEDKAEAILPVTKEIDEPIHLIRNLVLQDDGKWELNLKNETDFYFRKLEIWCIETKTKIFEFKLVEPQTRIKKLIDIDLGERIFFMHLVAQSEGRIVSVEYPVTPIQLTELEESESPEYSYQCKLKNMSNIVFNNLQVACAESPDIFNVENSEIKYDETTLGLIKFTKTPVQATFVVLDDNKIVSNQLQIDLIDEEDSEKSSDFEESKNSDSD